MGERKEYQWPVTAEMSQAEGLRKVLYVCLNELTALLPYSGHEAEHVHPRFSVHYIHHRVNHNERPSPANPSATRRENES